MRKLFLIFAISLLFFSCEKQSQTKEDTQLCLISEVQDYDAMIASKLKLNREVTEEVYNLFVLRNTAYDKYIANPSKLKSGRIVPLVLKKYCYQCRCNNCGFLGVIHTCTTQFPPCYGVTCPVCYQGMVNWAGDCYQESCESW